MVTMEMLESYRQYALTDPGTGHASFYVGIPTISAVAAGKSDSPEKRECRQNVQKCPKMSEKCSKIVQKWSAGAEKTQFSDIFLTILAYLVDAFVW